MDEQSVQTVERRATVKKAFYLEQGTCAALLEARNKTGIPMGVIIDMAVKDWATRTGQSAETEQIEEVDIPW